MTADFIQTAISKSAKRIFSTEFTNAAAYDAIIAEITGETNPLSLAEVELGKQTYKTYVGYFDPNTSEMNGKVQVTAYSRAEYSAAITALTGSADLKTGFGNGGAAETTEMQISNKLMKLMMIFLGFLIMLFGKLVESFLTGQR